MMSVTLYMRGGRKFVLAGIDREWAEQFVSDIQRALLDPDSHGSTFIDGRLMFNFSAIDVIQIGDSDEKEG